MIKRSWNVARGEIQTTICRKPTHTDRLLDQSSHNPTSHKATTIRTLTRRAQLVCDSSDSLQDETDYHEFFPPLLTNARPPSSFLLIVCRTGVKISRILFESDEYLCPLTVCYPPWCDRSPCNPSKWCHHHYTVSCIFLPNGPLTYVGGLPRESREFLIRNQSAKRHLWHLWRTSRLQLWIQKTNHKI